MPIHEFKCTECGKEFDELIMPGKEATADCPDCGAKDCEKLLSCGNVRPNGIPSGMGGYREPCKGCSGGSCS